MDPSEPIYTKQQASILTAVATLQTELRLSREQQARDSALFREQAAKDNAAIVFQLDKLNGSNSRHGEWIAGHIKEGEAQEKRLQRVEDAVDAPFRVLHRPGERTAYGPHSETLHATRRPNRPYRFSRRLRAKSLLISYN